MVPGLLTRRRILQPHSHYTRPDRSNLKGREHSGRFVGVRQICYAATMPKLLYFAQLVDALGIASENILLADEPVPLSRLLEILTQRGGVWQRVFSQPLTLRVAVNKTFAELDTPIGQNDEVAFVPAGPAA